MNDVLGEKGIINMHPTVSSFTFDLFTEQFVLMVLYFFFLQETEERTKNMR